MKLPPKWRTVRIAEFGKVVTGNTPTTSDDSNFGGPVPFVTPGDMGGPGLIRVAQRTLSLSGCRRARLVPANSTLVVCIGSTIGKIGLAGCELATNQQINAIVPAANVDGRFAYYEIGRVASTIRRLAGTQAVPIISKGDFEDFPATLPPLPEQQKIADILGTWDEALEKLDALIAAKARRKQALMQQLLAVAAQKVGHGHARHRLGILAERVTRKNTVGNENVLTISAQRGLINQREYFNRNVAGADLSGYYLLERGEFAYNRSSSIGFPYGALKRLDQYDAGIVSTLYLCFRIKPGAKVSSDYLAHYLDGGFLNAGLRSIAKEGARAHGLLNVTADEFLDLDIFIPPLPLQTKIAAVLDTADAELRLLRQKRTALDQQKRGLMQQLLTGRIRVSP